MELRSKHDHNVISNNLEMDVSTDFSAPDKLNSGSTICTMPCLGPSSRKSRSGNPAGFDGRRSMADDFGDFFGPKIQKHLMIYVEAAPSIV